MARDIIRAESQGLGAASISGAVFEFDGNEIQGDASDGIKEVRKALEPLNSHRFKK
ncbi:hypothetical protein [Burkholderia sp. IMCC1007]|uniref:hypothetical protein n=1 Tax=Burkholderia sp. IMCC1007 TaxID=3004104 RepID=UPI0022B3A573|nr:hypothetical protein [Burkholderia sp. IMCC1007]